MKRNHFLSLLLVLAMMLSTVSLCIIPAAAEGASDTWDGTADTSWYGDGTATEYTLTTAKQLAGLASLVNGGKTFAGKTVALGADLILNEGTVTDGAWTPAEGDNSKQWIPIGTEAAPFSGTFDGKGHTVSGMYYKGDLIQVGLFGVIQNATVSNISVDGYLQSSQSSATKTLSWYAQGGVVAYATYSTVSDCTSYTRVNLSVSKTEYICAGGVVGFVGAGTVVEDCANYGFVSILNSGNGGGSGANAGGVIGYACGAAAERARVAGCSNYGEVQVCTRNGSPNGNMGGIIGKSAFADIVGCNNYGTLERSTNNNTYKDGKTVGGGIVGDLYEGTNLSHSNNYGKISAFANAGGIAGQTSLTNRKTYEIVVHHCANYGDVETVSEHTSSKTPQSYAAGILGYFFSNTSTNLPVVLYSNYNAGDVTGNGFAAGLINISAANGVCHVYSSVNAGNITAKFIDKADAYAAGGINSISGLTDSGGANGRIQNCISIGTVALVDGRSDKTANTYHCYIGAFTGRYGNGSNNKNYYLQDSVAAIPSTLSAASKTENEDGTFTETGVYYLFAHAGSTPLADAQFAGTQTLENGSTVLQTLNDYSKNVTATSNKVTYTYTLGDWYQGNKAPLTTYEATLAELVVYAASITLGDKVTVNFYVENAGAAAALDYTLTLDGVKMVGKDTADGKYTVYTVADIDAKDLLKNYEITLTAPTEDGAGVITTDTLTYGVSKYIDRMSGKGNDKLDALLAALSDYAKAAAGEDVDVDAAYAAVELAPVANVDNTYVSAIALDLTDSIRPILEVADGVATVTVAIYGKTFTYEVVDGVVVIDCLTATSLNNEMVLSFLDAEGTVLGTTGYAVANYIKSVETLDLDLAKALAVYMQAARAYNGLN